MNQPPPEPTVAPTDPPKQAVVYSTWTTADGKTSGVVAVYTDPTGTWAKITVNGVVKVYEQIEAPA